MKLIKMNQCKFYVNEEKRTVVCKVPNTRYLLIDFLSGEADFKGFNPITGANHSLFANLTMPSTFTGKAVCNPEDQWNEELGRKIAFNRAVQKVYASFYKRAQAFTMNVTLNVQNMIDTLNNFGDKVDLDLAERDADIGNILGE